MDRREFRFEFPCPGCQARLRLQDRSLIGTRWNCPECHAALEIQDTGQGDLIARLAVASPLSPLTPGSRGIAPRAAAAIVAVTLIVGVAVFVLWPPARPQPPLTVQPPRGLPDPVLPAPTDTPLPALVDPVETQLTTLGKWLNGHYKQHGAFPSATVNHELPVEERMGWLALFREETETGRSVARDRSRGWQDPANEPFVRRRAPELLNPRVTAIASDESYPASHYVGVAGVGADAADLPKSHPRAGVFGTDRRTTLEDIQDGTTNTLMVVGVQAHPPAWASGTGSVTGLTAEPYFGGPDHLGTGQAEGMLVLMADGSVKFLSQETDPKIMRRMAAMADGLPLDANIPGEPSNPVTEPLPNLVQGRPPVPGPADQPITVDLVPEQVGYDVERGLAVSVIRFEMKTPVPLRVVLRQIVEMSALPIDTAQLQDDPRLDQLVTLDLQQTTIRGILEAALQQVQLEFTADTKGLHLQASTQPAAPVSSESVTPTAEQTSP